MEMRQTGKYMLLCGVAICAIAINGVAPIAAAAPAQESNSNDANTTTPIKHVIVIIGENRTFDHLFATYQPVKKGDTVLNLLSQDIVKADGTPGRTMQTSPNLRRKILRSIRSTLPGRANTGLCRPRWPAAGTLKLSMAERLTGSRRS